MNRRNFFWVGFGSVLAAAFRAPKPTTYTTTIDFGKLSLMLVKSEYESSVKTIDELTTDDPELTKRLAERRSDYVRQIKAIGESLEPTLTKTTTHVI